jgi:dienelactone hydrolase
MRANEPQHYVDRTVQVDSGSATLEGDLRMPDHPEGIVLFAHGSGSGRHSSRNRFVAEELREAGLASLLIDLLTAQEGAIDERTRHLRFDIPLLSQRLIGATDWLQQNPDTKDLSIGYFGASTGAGAALIAAAERPEAVKAVVSRGGRPDLAGTSLPEVKAPTLLIVGGRDFQVIDLNESALLQLGCVKEMVIVPGATHLFEEAGALEEVARLASVWFNQHLIHAP